MGRRKRNPMSSDTIKPITDAFKMKKRLYNNLNLKRVEKTPTPIKDDRCDPVASTSLKRMKTSPAYLRHKKTRLSQKKNDPGVTPLRTPKAAQGIVELRRSPRGFLQCTPSGSKKSLALQESPQEISWDSQSPRYRQHLKSGFVKGNSSHAKNVTDIINVLKLDEAPHQETQENPLTEMWVLSKTDAQQSCLAPSEASKRMPTRKPLKKARRVCEELAQLMKTTKAACSNDTQAAENTASPKDKEHTSTTATDEDNLWDDDSFFNDDSFIRQTQITEEEYFSQQIGVGKSAKLLPPPQINSSFIESTPVASVSNTPANNSSLKSRYTFRSSLHKTKHKELMNFSDSTTNNLPVNHIEGLSRRNSGVAKETAKFNLVNILDSPGSLPSVCDDILCPDTQTTSTSALNASCLNDSVYKVSPVSATLAPSCYNNCEFSSSVKQGTIFRRDVQDKSHEAALNQNSFYNSFRGRTKSPNITSKLVPGMEKSRSDVICPNPKSSLEHSTNGLPHNVKPNAEPSSKNVTHQSSKSDIEPQQKETTDCTLGDEMLDDDFFMGPDILELVEAAENTYLAASQSASQPRSLVSSQCASQPASQPCSQIRCTQEEIVKKREAALQRRRERALARSGKNV